MHKSKSCDISELWGNEVAHIHVHNQTEEHRKYKVLGNMVKREMVKKHKNIGFRFGQIIKKLLALQ
jgi:hypothetical protein